MESIYLRITEELNDLPEHTAKNIERIVFNILPIIIGIMVFTAMLKVTAMIGVFNDLALPALIIGVFSASGCIQITEWLKTDFYNHSKK